uniref:Uncharacterized protein n=1 Tax=Opuntia streptacantha TaxID=393608 RepID=A0A7C9AAE0_OPUST
MSSIEATHRLVSPGLGGHSHSASAFNITRSRAEFSEAPKTSLISDIFNVENGNFDEMARGKNDLPGILSLISGILKTVPCFNIASLKNLPSCTNLFTTLPPLVIGPFWLYPAKLIPFLSLSYPLKELLTP